MISRTMMMVATAVALLASASIAHAAPKAVIEPAETGPVGYIGFPTAQNFRPSVSGAITRVTFWSASEGVGNHGILRIHVGDRPENAIAQQDFVWGPPPMSLDLDTPVMVRAGQTYTVEASGNHVQIVLGSTDPYESGEVLFGTSIGWQTWTEWNGCGGGGPCIPYEVDQRVAIEISEAIADGDGDGVTDADDRCPDTVLPDAAASRLLSARYAATIDGFVGRDGEVVASLGDTAGCSATQIVDALHLGRGHLVFGVTRPHLERWIDDVAA